MKSRTLRMLVLGLTPVLAYSWDTAKLKEPLFAFLEERFGWILTHP